MQFGMKSTLLQFGGCYYVYQGAAKGKALSDKDIALNIGTYKSAFLTDIVASYVFEETEEFLEDAFSEGYTETMGGDYLQFTTKLWQPPPANKNNSPIKKDKKEKGATVIHMKEFPFLDMKMNWDKESGEIRFSVFRKPNQVLKCVNRGSIHRPTTFKFIASGVLIRLARLTSNIAANGKAKIDKIYLEHAKALFTADLAPPTDFPTLQEL
eukprot:10585849-Ditylum_brightwellii.AAC.1